MRELVRKLFTLDLRSLGALRIALGLVALVDIFYYRWPHAEMLLSDRGVLPLELFGKLYDSSYWSLYRISGEPTFVSALLLLQAVAAIAFLIGYRVRVASVLLLVLFWSVQARNPLTNTGGDVLIRNLVAWCCLLPMGARFSWEAWQRSRRGLGEFPGNCAEQTWCSLASAGLILQVVVMYFFAGVAKCNSYWLQGDALNWCLQYDFYLKPAGYLLQRFSWALPLITWGTLAMELAAPLFLLTPWRINFWRMAMLGCYWLFHLGIGAVYSIGIFSIAAASCWLMFLPASFWDWVTKPLRRMLDDLSEPKLTKELSETDRWLRYLAGAMLVFMFLINIANALPKSAASTIVQGLHELGRWTMFVQEYTMFGEPPLENPYYAIDAELNDGRRIDLVTGRLPNFEPSREQVFQWGTAQPWRRYLSNISPRADQPLSKAGQAAFDAMHYRVLEALVERWNSEHFGKDWVKKAEFIYFQRAINKGSEVPAAKQIIWAKWPTKKTSGKVSRR
jgi:hypothetical protein